MSINSVVLTGNLGRDPELRYTSNGTAVCSFSVAVNENYVKDGEKIQNTHWINCVAWTKTAELVAEHCQKGSKIGVTGSIQVRNWEDKDGNKRISTEVRVARIEFLGRPVSKSGEAPSGGTDSPSDDDIPF